MNLSKKNKRLIKGSFDENWIVYAFSNILKGKADINSFKQNLLCFVIFILLISMIVFYLIAPFKQDLIPIMLFFKIFLFLSIVLTTLFLKINK